MQSKKTHANEKRCTNQSIHWNFSKLAGGTLHGTAYLGYTQVVQDQQTDHHFLLTAAMDQKVSHR